MDAVNTSPQRPLIAPENPEPLWAQAAELIERQVREGALPAGSRLPAERELCNQLGISRVTLRRALQHLVERGVMRSSHGRGWYVAARSDREWPNSLESFTETARRKGLAPTSRVLRAEIKQASLDEADEFGVAAGADLFLLERVRMLDGVPIAVDSSRVAANLVPGLSSVDFTRASLLEELAAAGAEPVVAESTIEARGCPEDLAEPLELKPGDPALIMTQTMMDAADRVVLVSTITYRGDRYRLRTSFVRGS
ncbi:GntR family transcriptional regulator [Nonomuraea terrae]|uniref:GntR family transcriptional regulator n=1 Tax=Nonomuraea terrae TaxID=2530383 RepID=A0A4R4Z7F9_9ACTN|nr:GntR family transcriptional regulator [Nonomuraea terrae]TDD54085.1 GntR family transcriptional regulator [Nonomuraea terrae]